jgi:hypothetical protein
MTQKSLPTSRRKGFLLLLGMAPYPVFLLGMASYPVFLLGMAAYRVCP